MKPNGLFILAASSCAVTSPEPPVPDLPLVHASKHQPHPALLEYVVGDDPQNFLRDAATLRGWLAELGAT